MKEFFARARTIALDSKATEEARVQAVQLLGLSNFAEASAVLSGQPAGLHGIQGLGAGFVPAILDRSVFSKVMTVTDVAAERMARRMAREVGLLVGPSSGANVHAACEVAKRFTEGKVVTILCDSGERYLF